MVARTSTWTGSREALDKWEEHVKTQVSGFVAGLPGNAGGMFFIDRAGGTALTLTLWESEEAAAETDKFADQSRGEYSANSQSVTQLRKRSSSAAFL